MGAEKRARLRDDLRSFVSEHPSGWDHQDWLGLLSSLETKGIDVSETETIGLELERERVRQRLAELEISGLGPKRRDALAERFPTWWNLQHASTEQIAEIGSIHRALAEKVVRALQ